jgi:hypothetical protein
VRLSKTVAKPGATAPISPPPLGNAIIPPPTPIQATGRVFVVDTREAPLRLRSEPKVSEPPTKNVIGQLPDGHPVRAVTGKAVDGFIEVETSLFGAHLKGFASEKFLKPAPKSTLIPVETPAEKPPTTGIVAVTTPRKAGTVTKRVSFAGAHSLNEAGQPGRKGVRPEELVGELAKISEWLAVDAAAHKRYQPRDKKTFVTSTHTTTATLRVYSSPEFGGHSARSGTWRRVRRFSHSSRTQSRKCGQTTCSVGSAISARISDGVRPAHSINCRRRPIGARSA